MNNSLENILYCVKKGGVVLSQTMEFKQEINRLNKQFLHSSDFVAKEIMLGQEEKVILCYYSSLVNKTDVEQSLSNLKKLYQSSSQSNQESNQSTDNTKSNDTEINEKSADETAKKQLAIDDSVTITTEQYDNKKMLDYICNGETIIIFLQMDKMIRFSNPEFVHGTPDEPENEQILRGSHEGFVENFDSNVSLIRKRIKNNKLVVKKEIIGKETKSEAYYLYLDDVVDKETLKTVEERLKALKLDMYLNIGQLTDALDDNVWSPFPQLLSTERPDRVAANIMEGKIAIMTDVSPTALIGPVTFFTLYQTPDDYSARVVTGTFYRFMRMLSFLVAIFLPAFYIAIVSFHF